jgi:hypothetical protein
MSRLGAILTCLAIILSVIRVSGQHDKNAVEQMVQEHLAVLSKEGIQNWLVNWRYCNGQVEMIKMPDGSLCISSGTHYEAYVIWKTDQVYSINKFDNCSAYLPAEITDQGLATLLGGKWEKLMSESVKPYRSANYTGEPQLRKEVEPCFRDFHFRSAEANHTVVYNLYQMRNSEEEPNLNYQYNRSLAVNELDALLEEWLKANRTKFKRKK